MTRTEGHIGFSQEKTGGNLSLVAQRASQVPMKDVSSTCIVRLKGFRYRKVNSFKRGYLFVLFIIKHKNTCIFTLNYIILKQ